MAAYMIIYRDAAGHEHRERHVGNRTSLQNRVEQLQKLQMPKWPPVMWAQLKYCR